MTPGIGFALGAMLCFGVSDLIYKRGAAAGFSAREFLMSQAWIFCPGVVLYAWLTDTLHLQFSALWGGLAGLFLFVALFNFTRSLQSGAISTNAPIFRLNFTITAALAILLLGETLNAAKAIALLCALVAVWLLLAGGRTQNRKSSGSSLVRVLVATIAMALTNLFYKIGLQQGTLPETMVVAQALVFCPLATIFGLLREDRFHIPRGVWPYAAPAALALFGAFVAQMHGLALGPASVLVPVTQMGFVFTALLGAVIFHESLDARKCAGLGIAIVALTLFAVS